MTKELNLSAKAYNAAVDVLNDCDKRIAVLAMERDCAFNAANAFYHDTTHGGAQLPRNPVIKNGEVKAR